MQIHRNSPHPLPFLLWYFCLNSSPRQALSEGAAAQKPLQLQKLVDSPRLESSPEKSQLCHATMKSHNILQILHFSMFWRAVRNSHYMSLLKEPTVLTCKTTHAGTSPHQYIQQLPRWSFLNIFPLPKEHIWHPWNYNHLLLLRKAPSVHRKWCYFFW